MRPDSYGALPPPQSALSHICSSTRTRRAASLSGPTSKASPVSISAVVAARVRTSVGRSSLIGCAVPAFTSASKTPMVSRNSRRRGQTGPPPFLCAQDRSQPFDAGFVDMLCGKRGRQGFEHQTRAEQVTDGGAQVFEIDDHGAGSGPGIWLADEQPAVRSTTHSCHLMVLNQTHSFAQHRSTHAKALLQSAFRTQGCSDRPAAADDVRLDAAGDLRRSLVRPDRVRLGAHFNRVYCIG